MKRRILALLLPLALLFALGAQTAAAANTPRYAEAPQEALLPRSRSYEGQFSDVSDGAWYADYVAASYEYGLLEGRGDGFAPDANITVAELLTLSARIRAAYDAEEIPAADGAWYEPYAAYLREKGLLDETLGAYDANATRAQLAAILSLSLPESCFDGRNAVLVADALATGRYISDVAADTPYREQILWMYRQGLLSGMDESGSYWPDRQTTRAETSALLVRMVEPARRLTPAWQLWTSAAGTTLADLVEAPAHVRTSAPDFADAGAVEELVRQMLASGRSTIELSYPRPLQKSEAQALADAFIACVKVYCEQMYNTVVCTPYLNSGRVELAFGATACSGDALARYRAETMAKAIEVHDMLRQTGQITSGMSQYEIARVYFQWLCDHCEYDNAGRNDDYSASHLAYSALVEGKSVCDGYTGAYNLFLKLEGIECYALANKTHIWTVATLDGTEYHIDTTWGDRSEGVDWSCFAMSAEDSAKLHR